MILYVCGQDIPQALTDFSDEIQFYQVLHIAYLQVAEEIIQKAVMDSDTVGFTSRHGVEGLARSCSNIEDIKTRLAEKTIYCSGKRTASVLEREFAVTARVPDRNDSQGICGEMIRNGASKSVLHITSAEPLSVLSDCCRTASIAYRAISVYETAILPNDAFRKEFGNGETDLICIGSPSSADGMLLSLGKSDFRDIRGRFVCLGHSSAEHLRELGAADIHISTPAGLAGDIQTLMKGKI